MKILNNDKILKIILPTMLMIALALGCVKTDATESKEKQIDIEQNKVNVLYNTHIQNDGWEKDFSKKNGDTSGTSGRSLRLEAIKIKLDNLKGVYCLDKPLMDYRLHGNNAFGGRSFKQNMQIWKKENGNGYKSYMKYRHKVITDTYLAGVLMCKDFSRKVK